MRRTPASSCFSEMFRKFWNSLSVEVQSSHRFPWFTVKVTSHPVALFWYFFGWLSLNFTHGPDAFTLTWAFHFLTCSKTQWKLVEALIEHNEVRFVVHDSFPVVLASFLLRSSFVKTWGYLRILRGKKDRKIKLQRLRKTRIWTFGSLVRQINFLRGSKAGTNFPKK